MIYNNNDEHMTNISDSIDESVNLIKKKMLHHDICQIQQPQFGKNRPYVNWQKIHDYGSEPL